MIPTRQRVIREVRNYRRLLDEHPSYGEVKIHFSTFVDYLEGLLNEQQQDSRIPYRERARS